MQATQAFLLRYRQLDLVRELQSLLGRPPMSNEIAAWDTFLRSGNTLPICVCEF
jgi:hypothetical protein